MMRIYLSLLFIGLWTNADTGVYIQEEETIRKWSYEGENGPESWGKLDLGFQYCAIGKLQSPVNIEFSKVNKEARPDLLKIRYQPGLAAVENDGHTVHVHVRQEQNRILIDGEEYFLHNFHFHTPAEHEFNGNRYPMEMHLVHKNGTGDIAVIGVMITEGKVNPALKDIWQQLPTNKTEHSIPVSKPVEMRQLLPENPAFFHYTGSLTTPPCTENVKWFVFREPVQMSKKQIEAFRTIFPNNHRPVQPLHGRRIWKGKTAE